MQTIEGNRRICLSPFLGHMGVLMSFCVQLVNNHPAVQAILILFLGGEDPLEKG